MLSRCLYLWAMAVRKYENNLKKYCGVFCVDSIVAFLQDVLWQGMVVEGLIFRITALTYCATMQRSPYRFRSTREVGCHF
jgi:hypothetical protein